MDHGELQAPKYHTICILMYCVLIHSWSSEPFVKSILHQSIFIKESMRGL